MDRINTLISLNEAKKSIDEMIEKVKKGYEEETDYRELLIVILSVIGALVVIGAIAFAVYKYFSDDSFDEYDDLFDDEYEEDEEDDEESEEIISEVESDE